MARSIKRFWSQLLLTILLIVAVNSVVVADTNATVNFSGSATSPSTGTFSGAFAYDENDPASSDFLFKFSGNKYPHAVVYSLFPPAGGSGTVSHNGSNSGCEPFKITTSANTFTLTATLPLTPATTVTITIPLVGTILKTTLPGCSAFPTSAPYGTFALSGGGMNYTGKITAITSCREANIQQVQQEVYYVYACAPPAPAPVYACQPRQSCFLSRLFSRRCQRNSCW